MELHGEVQKLLFLRVMCWTWFWTASELGFQTFFWNSGCLWLQFKIFETHKEVFLLQIQKALDLLFPKHSLDHWLEEFSFWGNLIKKKKGFCKLGSVRSTLTRLQKIFFVEITFSLKIIFKLVIQGVFWKDNAKGFFLSVIKIPVHVSKRL